MPARMSEWHQALRRTTPMGTAPWSSVKQNEGIGGIGPEIGQRLSSSSAGSQPGTVNFSRMAKIASATPSAATSRSSPSDSTVSTSRRRGALHGAAISASSGRILGVLGPAVGAIGMTIGSDGTDGAPHTSGRTVCGSFRTLTCKLGLLGTARGSSYTHLQVYSMHPRLCGL